MVLRRRVEATRNQQGTGEIAHWGTTQCLGLIEFYWDTQRG